MRWEQRVSVTTETEQGLRRPTLRAHSRIHQVCHGIDGFRVLCVDRIFHVVIGVGRLTVQREGFIRQLHFTTHTQFHVVVRLCPVIVNSICIPESGIFHIAKTGPVRRCLYNLRLVLACSRLAVIFDTLMICFC